MLEVLFLTTCFSVHLDIDFTTNTRKLMESQSCHQIVSVIKHFDERAISRDSCSPTDTTWETLFTKMKDDLPLSLYKNVCIFCVKRPFFASILQEDISIKARPNWFVVLRAKLLKKMGRSVGKKIKIKIAFWSQKLENY